MIQPDSNQLERPKTEDDLMGDDLKQYEADIEAMHFILISIPNDIYNYVDSCQTANEMWLRQYEKLVIASRAKNLEKTHDPLALVAHTWDTFQNDLEDPLTSAMMLLARAITQQMLEMMEELKEDRTIFKKKLLRVAIAKGHYARDCLKPRVCDSKYIMEQMLLAKKDEAGVSLSNEQNDFHLADATQMEELEELSANICMIARIQPANIDSDEGPSYNFAFISDVIQIILWIVDRGWSKHMTRDLKQLKNFIEKFMGTVRFGNDHIIAITGYGDYLHDNITICHVYYVEGLGYNLFSVGKFFHDDLEVAFRSKTCYVRNLEGDDLLTSARDSNLHTISISDMEASFPIFLMFKDTSTNSWLWHRRLSHLNFGTINHLTKQDLVDGLSKFKYDKDHLCYACEREKRKKATIPLKLVHSFYSKLELIHMDLCGPMRVKSINGKKYILVIVDDYSHYTWVQIQKFRTDSGTEFKNATL
ncbi:retrovirus-related pol polyprotein from transposon TNT 1-94 [Tanacetum coccineum]